MRTIDFSLLLRHSIGFDRIQRLADATHQCDNSPKSYPPYNIKRVGEKGYRNSMGIAGFREDEIHVTFKENILFISGSQTDDDDDIYRHRGIAGRVVVF